MNYKGFTIFQDFNGWKVRVSVFEEWLATSKEDAIRQVDEYVSRSIVKAA